MTVVVNPKTVVVTDNNVAIEGDTAFVLKLGTVSGGPYTASSATVPIAGLPVAGGAYSVSWGSITWAPALNPFTTYFMVAEAQNAQGVSGNSPEASFSLAAAPLPPIGLAIS
jgi:hypothetical protein